MKSNKNFLRAENKRMASRTVGEKEKMKRILLVSAYGRAARRTHWMKVRASDGLTWQEYKELESMLKEGSGRVTYGGLTPEEAKKEAYNAFR